MNQKQELKRNHFPEVSLRLHILCGQVGALPDLIPIPLGLPPTLWETLSQPFGPERGGHVANASQQESSQLEPGTQALGRGWGPWAVDGIQES